MMSIDLFSDMEEYEICEPGFGQPTLFLIEKLTVISFSHRRVKFLSLEGCSLLTTEGLEATVLSWLDLETLVVVSCKNIKEGDISPALATLFCNLKELRWRPDTKSLLSLSLVGTGMGKKGGKFFKRT